MRSKLALAVFGLAVVVGLWLVNAPAQAAPPPRATETELMGTYTGSISASNAAVTSLVDATDTFVLKTLVVTSSQAGTLTFTDGSSGVAVLCQYVAANTPFAFPVGHFKDGLRITKGNELYVNALSSATISVSYAYSLERGAR